MAKHSIGNRTSWPNCRRTFPIKLHLNPNLAYPPPSRSLHLDPPSTLKVPLRNILTTSDSQLMRVAWCCLKSLLTRQPKQPVCSLTVLLTAVKSTAHLLRGALADHARN